MKNQIMPERHPDRDYFKSVPWRYLLCLMLFTVLVILSVVGHRSWVSQTKLEETSVSIIPISHIAPPEKFLGLWQGAWAGQVPFTVEFQSFQAPNIIKTVLIHKNDPARNLTDDPIFIDAQYKEGVVTYDGDGYFSRYWFEGDQLQANLSGAAQASTKLTPLTNSSKNNLP